jgi:arylsulfatase A-like enzyme
MPAVLCVADHEPRNRSRRLLRIVSALLLVVVASCGNGGDDDADRSAAGPASPDRPNIVVIMTDDQTLAEMAYLPRTTELIGGDVGVTFANAFAVFPLCCPARATMLTGQYAHNTGVVDNVAPNGGENLQADTALPTWFQASGYRTALVGKYFNGYGTTIPPEAPPGWDDWFGLLDPEGLNYFGAGAIDNGERVTLAEDVYTTDALAARAVADIEQFAGDDEAFLLAVWTSAPHSGKGPGVPNPVSPAPAPRHADLFPNATVPRTPSFLEADVADKPPAVTNARVKIERALLERGLDEAGLVDMLDVTARARAQSLAAVDELVVGVVDALERTGQLDNTVLVFTSDNGWLTGQHGVPFAKVLPYEASIRVPLLVRGPGFPAGTTVVQPVGHHDVAPTLAEAAGVTPSVTTDGRPLQALAADPGLERNRVLLLQSRTQDETYAGLRLPGWVYVEWDDGAVELYDLLADPHQLTNAAGDPRYSVAQQRLAAALATLRSCSGATCQLEIAGDELR